MDTRNRSYTVELLMEYLAWCWYSINICWKKSTCLDKLGRMLGGLDICPPFFHAFFQLFCLPSPVQPRIIQLLHILFLASRKWAFKEYLLCVCVIFRKTDVCRRGPGPHGAVLIPDRHFTEIYLETCGQPKGHRHHPSCQWACFCATSLPALLCSCVMEEQTFWLLLCCPLQITPLGALFTSFPLHPLPRNAFSDLPSHISPFPPVSFQPPFKKVSWVTLHMFICYSLYSATVHTQILMCNPGMIITDDKVQMNTWMRKTYKY